MLKPEKLRKNDKVAIVAPSMAAKKDTVNKAAEMVRKLGLEPVVYKSCYLIDDEKNVSDKLRADDINHAFKDNSIKGIISLKAGYGTQSLLNFIDYEVIKENPKVFIGFSDITALHLALNKLCNMVSFHGPLATSRIYKKDKSGFEFDQYTYDYLYKNLFEDKPLGIIQNPQNENLDCLYAGVANGQLIGGNLTLLVKTLGTKYEIETKGRILFIEDMGETLDNIYNMLTQLEDAKKFEDCSGVILGTWIRCGEEYSNENERQEKLKEIFNKVLVKYRKPVLLNLRGGHNVPMITLPFGVNVVIDAEERQINFTEGACR